MDTDFFLSQSDTAKFLLVSERTLERWRVTGDGPPFVKMSRRVAYRQSDLLKWTDARVFHSTTEAQQAGAR